MNDERPPIVPMLLANLLQTLLTVLGCVLLGYVLAYFANWALDPRAARVVLDGEGTATPSELAAYAARRDAIVSFAATAGLFAIQTVFLVRHLWTPPQPSAKRAVEDFT